MLRYGVKDFLIKSENWWLFGFLLLIPTQLGKFFWPEWSQVMGIRIDFLAPVIYLVDLVWLGLVVIWRLKEGKINFELVGWGVVVLILLNIWVAENREIAIYRWLRLGQWWWFYRYCNENKEMVRETVLKVIPWWIGVEVLLGLAQVIKGGSLQGIWYWLGERRFDLNTIGVASFSMLGNGLTRAYGTFSHPNSMAGFILITLALWIKLKYLQIIHFNLLKRIWWWIVIWLGGLGIVITGSRTVWAVVAMVFMLILVTERKNWYKNKSKIFGYIIFGLGWLLVIFSLISVNYRLEDFVGGWDRESLDKRMSLNTVAVKMWWDNRMEGVGAGNFLVRLPEYQTGERLYLQPVHNIFLLVLAEMGVLGLLLVLWIFKDFWKWTVCKSKWIIFFLIMATGMMDHYWITLPQNSWLMALVLAIW